MSDPYREAGGTACPRCQSVLAPDDDVGGGELVCLNGCGRWMPDDAAAELFPTELIVERAKGNPFHVNPLPWVKCLQCGRTPQPIYAGFASPLILSRCAGHGTWIDDAVREHFLEAYADTIREILDAKARAGEHAALVADLTAGSASAFRALLDRIAVLEARVAQLERR